MSKLETNTIDTVSGTNTLQVGDGNVATVNLGKSGDTIVIPAGANATLGGSGSTITIPSGSTITNSGTANNFGGGKIGQVVSVLKTSKFTTSSTSMTDVTGLTVNITPAATSSKVLVTVSLGSFQNGSNNARAYASILRNSTALAQGDAATGVECTFASCQRSNDGQWVQAPTAFSFLDSPSTTSETTYKLQATIGGDGGNVAINSSYSNDSNSGNCSSTITVMEILA